MSFEFWVKVVGIIMVLTGFGIGHFIGDPAFHIRVVQDGNHETIFVLLALIIGFTFKDSKDSNSMSALIWAVFMAVFGLLMGGLNDLESERVQFIGLIFYTCFIVSMVGTLMYLMRALKCRR